MKAFAVSSIAYQELALGKPHQVVMDLSDPERRSQTDVCLADSHLAFPSAFKGECPLSCEGKQIMLDRKVREEVQALMSRSHLLLLSTGSHTGL